MAKSSKTGGILFTLLVVGAIGYGGWYFWKSRAPKDPTFSTATVGTATIKQTVTATGDLLLRTQIDVGSLVSGKVIGVYKDFNDTVKKGDKLVLIDPADYEAKVRQAENSLKTARLNAENTERDARRTLDLFEKGLATSQEAERARVSLVSAPISIENAQIALDNAKVNLDRCTVVSPIDGIVLNRLVDEGKSVNASQNVANLFVIVSSFKEMKIEALVSEADIGLVKADLPVEFTVDAFPARTFRATVKQVRNQSRNASGVISYPVLIEVANEEEVLKPGMSASVAIVIANRPNVPAIPNGTLRARIPTDFEKTGIEIRKVGATTTSTTAPAAAPAPQQTLPEGQAPAQGQGRGGRGEGFAGGGGRGGGGRGGRGGGNLGNLGEGQNVVNVARPVYRLIEENGKKVIEQLEVRTGISDAQNTELLPGSGLNAGDKLITFITMPGAAPVLTSAPQNANAFGNQGRGGAAGGGGRGGGGGGGGRGF